MRKIIFLNEAEKPVKTFYHLSKEKVGRMIPRIPKSDFEEQKTPRICVSSSIQGCLIGINENKNIIGETFNVYTITTNKYHIPSNKEVADRDITGEVWVLNECTPEYQYKIKIIGKKSSSYKKIDGKFFEVPVWNYEKINDLKEDVELITADYLIDLLG